MTRRSFSLALVLLTSLLLQLAPAAETYKKGDEIEVYFLNKWYKATVIATNARGEVLAEYEFITGRPQQRAFKAAEVRAAYESGALARGRTWSDTSGSFKVKAALIELNEDSVLLRKEDMNEVKVPIEKLSAADKSYLKRLEKELGPIAAKAVEVEEFTEGAQFNSQAWLQTERVAITPDPIPQDLKLKQGGVVLQMAHLSDKLGAILPLGGPDAMLLAAVEYGGEPTRLIWASLDKQRVNGEQKLPEDEVVMDYHSPSHRLLTWSLVKSQQNPAGEASLTLWDVQASDKQPKAVVRWNAKAPWTVDPWARLLDGDTVLHRQAKQEYVVWDAKAKELRYRLKQESFFGAPAALSGGRKYLVLPEDSRIRVLEAATGKLMCTLPADGGSSGVAVSPDGVRLAVLNRNTLTVWDLTNATAPPEVHQAEAIGTPFSADLDWSSQDTIAVSNSLHRDLTLFSLKLKIALWRYEFDWNAVRDDKGRRLRDIVDGHLVYAASVSRGLQNSLAVGAVALPGPRVNEVAATTTRESLLVIKPGSGVRLEVNAGEHQARVEAALTKQIADNGWVLQPDASNVLSAEMKLGETQSVTYTSRRTGEEFPVSITPHVASLVLKVGSNVAWQSGTSAGLSPFMFLGPGQTAQEEADKRNRPRPEFFETVDMPDSLLDPTKRNGLGVTQVTNRGLVPK
jgi:hypothetical protein